MRVAPGEEQEVIDFMHKLFWNLLSTQEIKTSDNYLERKADVIYQKRSTDHYVKLAFSRYLDTPHLDKIRALEKEYFDLPEPVYPKLFPYGIISWIIGGVAVVAITFSIIKSMLGLLVGFGIAVGIWFFYFSIHYSVNKDRANRQAKQLVISRQEILERLKHLEKLDE